MCGKVAVEERIWRDARKVTGGFFARIGVRARAKSRALTRVLSDFGAEHAFAPAAARVEEHYGFERPASAVRTATLETARRTQENLTAQYARPYRGLPVSGRERMIAEADGTR